MKKRQYYITTRTNYGRKYRHGGFSLIEILIALAVLVFGIYGVLDLYFNAERLSRRAITRTQAVYLAKGKFAELQAAASFEEQLSQVAQAGETYTSSVKGIGAEKDFQYNWSLTPDEENENAYRLAVSVTSTLYPDVSTTVYRYFPKK